MNDIYAYDARKHILYVVPSKPYPMRVYNDSLKARTRQYSPDDVARTTAQVIVVGSIDWWEHVGEPRDGSSAPMTRRTTDAGRHYY